MVGWRYLHDFGGKFFVEKISAINDTVNRWIVKVKWNNGAKKPLGKLPSSRNLQKPKTKEIGPSHDANGTVSAGQGVKCSDVLKMNEVFLRQLVANWYDDGCESERKSFVRELSAFKTISLDLKRMLHKCPRHRL